MTGQTYSLVPVNKTWMPDMHLLHKITDRWSGLVDQWAQLLSRSDNWVMVEEHCQTGHWAETNRTHFTPTITIIMWIWSYLVVPFFFSKLRIESWAWCLWKHWQNSRVLKDGSSEQPNLPTPLLDEKAPIDIISSGKYLQWKKLHFCSDGEWEPEHSNSSLFIF